MNQTTPTSINEEVLKFCKEVNPTTNPIFVNVIPIKDAIYGCYGNVENHIKKNGGRIEYGWIIWEVPEIYLEAEFHAVWVNNEEEYIDITPKVDREKRILFLKDNKKKFEGKLIDNIRKPLVDNEFTRDLIRQGKKNFEIKNKYYKESPGIKTRKIGRNELCPCGGGKKYKKCCMVY